MNWFITKLHEYRVNSVLSRIFEEDSEAIVKNITRAFGLTSDPSEAGFILADGKMLDFSGKRIGGPPGTRAMDHSEVSSYIPGEHDSNWSKYKALGMGSGAIRCGQGNLDIFKEPTKAQYSTLRRKIIPYYLQEFYVNLDLNGNGKEASQSYGKRVPVQRIINDIKTYYSTGKVSPLPPHLQFERDGSGIFKRIEGGKARYSARCPVTGIIHGDFLDLKSALENRLYKTAFVDKIDRYKKELEKLDKPPKNGKPLKTGLKIKQ